MHEQLTLNDWLGLAPFAVVYLVGVWFITRSIVKSVLNIWTLVRDAQYRRSLEKIHGE